MPKHAATVSALVQQLREASAAYYNGGPARMDDDTYDAAVERLRELDPENPFLTEVGAAPPEEGAVPLPFKMPSLDKIKPGEDRLKRWLGADKGRGFVVSEKLDGLSALWMPGAAGATGKGGAGSKGGKLYLRGDGVTGQDVSHLVGLGLTGLPLLPDGTALRGELLLSRAAGEPLARSWVNGVVHRKEAAPADVAKIRFVAYEVLAPTGMTRQAQMKWLEDRGVEVPWWSVAATGLTEEALAARLQARRLHSAYDTDGLVVGYNAVPQPESTAVRAKNPKDAVAFKMPLAEQSAETTVRAVEWGTSAQGYLIPTLRFDPVQISGATIQLCTGHNAKTVKEGGIGPGARVVIRRSGDVIPKLDRVVTACSPAIVEAAFPETGTWEWDGTQTHIRLVGGADGVTNAASKELLIARMEHFLKTLEIPGSGPATARALVEGGLTGPAALWAATAERLAELLGPKTGAGLWENLRGALGSEGKPGKVSEKTLMLASSQMPRGVGDTKLTALFEVGKHPRLWKMAVSERGIPAGWTAASLEAFWGALEGYERWRAKELAWLEYPVRGVPPLNSAKAATGPPGSAGTLCMTGFRDAALEAAAVAAGWSVADGVTGKTTLLLVPDGEVKESGKVKAARAKGIPILGRSAFAAKLSAGSVTTK